MSKKQTWLERPRTRSKQLVEALLPYRLAVFSFMPSLEIFTAATANTSATQLTEAKPAHCFGQFETESGLWYAAVLRGQRRRSHNGSSLIVLRAAQLPEDEQVFADVFGPNRGSIEYLIGQVAHLAVKLVEYTTDSGFVLPAGMLQVQYRAGAPCLFEGQAIQQLEYQPPTIEQAPPPRRLLQPGSFGGADVNNLPSL